MYLFSVLKSEIITFCIFFFLWLGSLAKNIPFLHDAAIKNNCN